MFLLLWPLAWTLATYRLYFLGIDTSESRATPPRHLATLTHECYADPRDPYQCRALLNNGTWTQTTTQGPPLTTEERWQPHGCDIHDYSSDELHRCFDGRRLAFLGDSTVRQTFREAAKKFDAHLLDSLPSKSHQNIHLQSRNVMIDFIWDPWLNSKRFGIEVRNGMRSGSPQEPLGTPGLDNNTTTAMLVIGAPGLWPIRYGAEDYLEPFRRSSSSVQALLRTSFDELAADRVADIPRIVLVPVQSLNHDRLDEKRASTMTSERIADLNSLIRRTIPSSHTLWAQNAMLDGCSARYQADGLHVASHIASTRANIVLNAHCNLGLVDMPRSRRICCSKDTTKLSELLAGPNMILFTPLYTSFTALTTQRQSWRHPGFAALYSLLGLLVLGGLASTMDRSSLFHKGTRSSGHGLIVRYSAAWVFISLLSWVKMTSPVPLDHDARTAFNPRSPARTATGFLSALQSEEIKGLMQMIILIYHYYHGSQVLWIYKTVRTLVSFYFFLSAYGHTTYFLDRENISLRRVANVLFRTNLLTLVLMGFMGTSYTTYYFVPALSFWFCVVWLALGLRKADNRRLVPFCLKMALCALVTDNMLLAPGILEKFVQIINNVLPLHIDDHEIRFRLELERYVVYAGSILAFLVHRHRASLAMRYSHQMRMCMRALVPCVLVYGYTFWHFNDKEAYNRVHPYVSWIPILAFVIVRNSTQTLRNGHMSLPAKVGSMSLETYLLQSHIWLADSAKSKLQIGIFRHSENAWRSPRIIMLGESVEQIALFIEFLAWSRAGRMFTSALTQFLFKLW
ncbi:10 TM acyl transferase domain found in Cas1p-domain-containing protein [Microdochium bolleyi]|uniref:10 TM acyl transferase domain found in Cas1p-domain-containing protein n=1 Tax=Microdochium bolleyi TaxID=196109 RepID=A0A136JJZ5_9PEZI|nr:10 TM acyl transferase domain found in Cas1p-domain-containing protein [Microdochium bolleyi]